MKYNDPVPADSYPPRGYVNPPTTAEFDHGYPHQGPFARAYPPPPPPPPPFQGYQGYFSDEYPPPQPPVSSSQQYYSSFPDESSFLSFLQGCMAALCCCCLLENCCY